MSRLTFRDKTEVCWQRQLRDRFLEEGTPPVPHLDVKKAIVRQVSRRLTEQIILKYEWLGTMASTSLHYGIFFGAYCAGVACVAVNGVGTAGPYVHCQFGIKREKLATLARGACVHWAPVGTNSRLVSWVCRLLSIDNNSQVIIAYSDSDAGEIGTIYQACNWTYIGRSVGVARGDMQIISPSGRVLNKRALGKYARDGGCSIREMRARLKEGGWQEQSINPKHRYVYVLDRKNIELAARIERMRQPYPKRAGSIDDDAPAIQAGEGGSTPTSALHIPTQDHAPSHPRR